MVESVGTNLVMNDGEKDRLKKKWEKEQQKFIERNQGQSVGILFSINILYEKSYYDIGKRFYLNIHNSKYQRDEKAAVVIMSALSLEAFINRIGIEILSKIDPTFDIKNSLEKDRFLDKFDKYTRRITGQSFYKGGKSWHDLKELYKDRNLLVHAKPYPVNFYQGERGPKFFSDDSVLNRRFETVAKTVKYLLNEIKIPSYPSQKDILVYDYTDDNARQPPMGVLARAQPAQYNKKN